MRRRTHFGGARWGRLAALGCAAAVMAAGTAVGQTNPDPVVVIDTGQRVWRVPYRYLAIRPPLQALEPVNRWGRFSVAFWMPDGRPALGAGLGAGTPRPHEPGRPPPGAEEYLFLAIHITPWAQAGPLPGMVLENVLHTGSENYDFGGEWGMIKITPRAGQAGNSTSYFGTLRLSPPAYEASWLIHCPIEGTPGNNEFTVHRLCSGIASIRGLEIRMNIQIPVDQLRDFPRALRTLSDLLAPWVRT